MRTLIAAIVLLSGASVFAGTGRIQCDQGQAKIPAWTAPGSAFLVDQLTCDQTVSVIGFDRGYAKIQIGNQVAYVNAKYLNSGQIPGQGESMHGAQGAFPSRESLQNNDGDMEFGFSGAGFVTHRSPVMGTLVVGGAIGKYFKGSEYLGAYVAPGIQFGGGETSGDIFYAAEYRHFFSGKGAKVAPFVGALGGAVSYFGQGNTTTYGTAAPELGIQINASSRTVFELAYQMPIVLNMDTWGTGFAGRSMSLITFGFKWRFGATK